MSKHSDTLSIPSRILVAFASGALIAVFFLPAWRIDLFAPQYPEGLTMNIWINTLSGDIDIINGLNHYIGMRPFSVADFPEFKFLPYVVGFFMLLGMTVAITGKRKLLLVYLILTVIGGALAIYDFYQWEYNYGHNLDPKAPIQVPGMSYQPPLFGHKRLLNFDAYSFPDTGGWVVVGAAMLAFSVWLVEWYRSRKQSKMRTSSLITVLFACLFMVSCSAQPEPFKYGKDNCHTCKMGIMDAKFGAELVTKKGKVYKFDDVVCMVRFIKSGAVAENEIKQQLLINYQKENDFLEADKAFFYVSPDVKSPMGSDAAAFATKDAAEKFKAGKGGKIMNWKEVYEAIQ